MPINKQDSEKVVEILRRWRTNLDQSDNTLRSSIDKVAEVFDSQLFCALIDIQNYYECLLCDRPVLSHDPTSESSLTPVRRDVEEIGEDEEEISLKGDFSGVVDIDYLPNFEYSEVSLIRWDNGFGFSISGGRDMPYVKGDPSIYITKIFENGAAKSSGLLKVNDIVCSVNGISLENVDRKTAITVMKSAEYSIHMVIRRPKTGGFDGSMHYTESPLWHSDVFHVEIRKTDSSKDFGFSISSGKGSEVGESDRSLRSGIYITRITEGGLVEKTGLVCIGDRILAVNDVDVKNHKSKDVVDILKKAGNTLHLTLSRPSAVQAPKAQQ